RGFDHMMVSCLVSLFFFFSSRRRHTRSDRDWSSDVCSSDLDAVEATQRVHTADIVGMTAGQVRYGPFVDEDGLLVDDGTVFRFEIGRASCRERVEMRGGGG